MHDVKIDQQKNRLYLTLGKLEGAEEIAVVAAQIREACQSLKRGFSCLTDMRDYELLDERLEAYVKDIQALLVEAGMNKVVRVVRRFGTWGHLQLDRSAVNLGYYARKANSIEEALTILDEDDPNQ